MWGYDINCEVMYQIVCHDIGGGPKGDDDGNSGGKKSAESRLQGQGCTSTGTSPPL